MNLLKAEIYKFFVEYKKNYKKNIISIIFYSMLFVIFYISIVNMKDGINQIASFEQFYYFLIYFLVIRIILAAISGPISVIFEESRKKKLANMDSNYYPIEKVILVRSIINYINTFVIMILVFIATVLILNYGISFFSLLLTVVYLFIGSLALLGIGFLVAGLVMNFQLKTAIIVFFQLGTMALLFINIKSGLINSLLPFVQTFKRLYENIYVSFEMKDLIILMNGIIYFLIGYIVFCYLTEKMRNKIGVKYLDIVK